MKTYPAVVVLLSLVGTALCGGGPMPKAPIYSQAQLDSMCADCYGCRLPDPSDCRYYISCEGTIGYRKICGLGTIWNDNHQTCDFYSTTPCANPLCAPGYQGNVDHDDGFCKTYWKCNGGGMGVPKCCPASEKFDYDLKTCVKATGDETCNMKCDLSLKGVCSDPDAQPNELKGIECGEYIDCILSTDFTSCCPQGFRYSTAIGECVQDNNCAMQCSKPELINQCAYGTSEKVKVSDDYCGSYLLCNGTTVAEKRCCAHPTPYFDRVNNQCVATNTYPCEQKCPGDFIYDCTLEANPGFPETYKQGKSIMNCAGGTVFVEALCGCGKRTANPPDTACSIEADLTVGDQEMVNTGSENMVEMNLLGQFIEGPMFAERGTWKVNGNSSIDIPFFQATFTEFFLKVVYYPEQSGMMNMVLSSNCYVDKFDKRPSFEVAIKGGNIVLSVIMFDAVNGTTEQYVLGVPTRMEQWNEFVAYLNKGRLQIQNDDGVQKESSEAYVSGEVMSAAEGMHFGACQYPDPFQDSFYGYISQIQFAKCVKPSWMVIPDRP